MPNITFPKSTSAKPAGTTHVTNGTASRISASIVLRLSYISRPFNHEGRWHDTTMLCHQAASPRSNGCLFHSLLFLFTTLSARVCFIGGQFRFGGSSESLPLEFICHLACISDLHEDWALDTGPQRWLDSLWNLSQTWNQI
jgi:hypothetical protein